ncbi:MAG: ABC transporter ATP-binding protein [Pseudomonadota bacterium]
MMLAAKEHASTPASGATGKSVRPGVTVEVADVSMLYATMAGQPTWALRKLSFRIAPSEFVCAVGPSGCGKTTLLHLIAGFLQPIRGAVLLDGRPVARPGPDRGVVFQEYGLFPWLTVRANVEFGLRARGVARPERRRVVDAYLDLVGLREADNRYPFELSGGMRQRVAVARALVNQPQLLLMDEPFAAVDAMTRATLQDELVRLWQREGCACFFITHSIDEAVYLGQTILAMSPHPGRLKEIVVVDLPYPRDRDCARFRDVTRRINLALQH